MTAQTESPARHQVRAILTGTRAVVEWPGAPSEIVTAGEGEDLRGVVLEHVTRLTMMQEQDIELMSVGDRGDNRLLITATGEVSRLPLEEPAQPAQEASGVDEPVPVVDESEQVPVTGDLAVLVDADSTSTSDIVVPAVVESEFPEEADAFLLFGVEQEAIEVETERGWRSLTSALTMRGRAPVGGDDRTVVAQHWPGCRKIAVVNVMGGQGCTITAAMMAAVYGRFGGGAVLAWDNSDALGALGWRTEAGPHAAEIPELVAASAQLLAPEAGVSAIAGYVHHQTEDRYDVLRRSSALFGPRADLSGEDFDELVAVADRYYRMVIFDSGKDAAGQRWLRMLDIADQLVIPVSADVQSAEGVLALLDQLRRRNGRSALLAENAVVMITQTRTVDARTVRAITDAIANTGAVVEVLTFDAGLASGQLRFDGLRRSTQDTLVKIAAHAARRMQK